MVSKPLSEEAIFKSACKIKSAGDRADYLKKSCAGNELLHQRMIALLRIFDEEKSFLEPPFTTDVPFDLPLVEPAGTRIGDYRLLEPIGEGGMGTVYLAEQNEPVHRQVALKLIKPGMDTRQVVARFEAEERALALMDHPNIAQVFDAGMTPSDSPPYQGGAWGGGRPYFVMELVKGKPIHQFCDQHQLDVKQRLELFIQVCHGVQHAHQKGIIHRDLKPSNILVATYDELPVPKVIDFGVAKATGVQLTEETMFTRYGQVVGTLEYMSPEQTQFNPGAPGDVDTRSDIYSLGTILYELLTGSPPYDRERMKDQPFDETLRMIRDEEPTRPSTRLSSAGQLARIADNRHTSPHKLSALLHGDLDWIVMKALEKDRTRRYETANELALDVQRYLNDEPVLAKRPTAVHRIAKWTHRHPAIMWSAVTLLVITLISLSLGVIGLLISRNMIAQEKTNTQKALDEARNHAAIAAAVNEFVNTDLLGKADPHEEPHRDLKVSAVLDQALLSIEGRFTDQPLAEAGIRTTIAMALQNLGRIDEAEQQLTAVHQIYEREFGPHDRQTLDVERALLWNGHDQDNYQPCLERHEELLGLLIDRFGSDDPLTLRTAAQCADLNRHLGRYRESELQFREVLAAQERVLGPDHEGTLGTIGNLAMTIAALGRYGEAEKLFARLVEHSARAFGPEHPKTLSCKMGLANAVFEQGRYAEAEELYREILPIQRRVLGAEHPNTLGSMGGLAKAMRQAGRLNESLPMLEQVLVLTKGNFGEDHPETVNAMNNLAMAYVDTGDSETAIPLLEQTLEKQKIQLGEDHPQSLISMSNLAHAYTRTRQFEKAIPLLEQSLALWESTQGEDHPDTAIIMNNLALAYQGAGQLDRALPFFEKSLDQKKALLGPDHPKTLNSMGNLASAYMDAGEFAKGLRLMEQTVELFKAKLGEDHPTTLHDMHNLAQHYWMMGQLDKSIPLFEEVLNQQKAKWGHDHRLTQLTVSNLGTNYKDAGRLDEALPLLEQGYQAMKDDPVYSIMGAPLIDAYLKIGETDKAEAVAEELMEKIVRRLPQDSPRRAQLLASLAGNYFLPVEAWSDAESMLRQSLVIREAVMPDKWQTFNTRSQLGRALMGQEKYAEAESYLLKGYQGVAERRKLIPPISESRLTRSLQALVELYESWHNIEPDAGHDSQAKRWRRQLQKHNAAITENETK